MISSRQITDLSCGQYVFLKDSSVYKERKELTEEIVVKRQKINRKEKKLFRAIEI